MIEKKILVNTLFLYFRMILIMMVTLYTSRIILKQLGAEDYGIYNVVGGVVALVTFLNNALSNGFQRYFNIEIGRKNERGLQITLSTAILVQLLLIVFSLIFTETIGLWFVNNELMIPQNRMVATNWVYQTSIFILAMTLLRAPFHALIISYEKMKVFAYISIIEVIVQLGMVFSLNLFSYDHLIIYGLMMSLISLLILLTYMYFAYKCNTNLKFKPIIDANYMKSILSFSGWNTFGSFAHVIKINGINIVLNMFFNPIVNTALGFANQVANGVTALSSNILVASQPRVIQSYAIGETSKVIDITYSIIRYSFFLLWIMCLPILIQTDFIYHIWLGNDVPNYTEIFTRLVLINTLIDCAASPLATMVYASGKMKKYQLTLSSIFICIVPFSYIALLLKGSPESVLYVGILISIATMFARVTIIKQIYPDFSYRRFFKLSILPCFKVIIFSVIIVLILDYIFRHFSGYNKEDILIQCIRLVTIILATTVITCYSGLDNKETSLLKQKIKNIIYRK